MPEPFQAPPGVNDVLPPESARWSALVGLFARRAELAGYGLVVGPVFEDVRVFERVGESTDIVRKEMFAFQDKGGRNVALRPESTAGVVRAFVQHRPPVPFKCWYAAPHFRHEKAQRGRYRQHHQLGVEVLGSDDPDLDVEVIALSAGLFADVGLARLTLRLNSLGDAVCRPEYVALLRAYLEDRSQGLCEEHRERIGANPLRVLDCKRPPCQDVARDAPRMVDHLCAACQAHFERVRAGLGALAIEYAIDTSLVRGLDYYTRTTFEFAAEALESAQNAVGGGGRYDGLAEALGGPPTPGIGFGLGVERILLACDAEGVFPAPESAVDVFVVDTVGDAALALTHELRAVGIRADRAFDARSMKSQMKAADRSGARLAVIHGPAEADERTVIVRDLAGSEQWSVPRDRIVDEVRKLLS